MKTKTKTNICTIHMLGVIEWFSDSDTVAYSWQIEKLQSLQWGLVTDNQRVPGQRSQFLWCLLLGIKRHVCIAGTWNDEVCIEEFLSRASLGKTSWGKKCFLSGIARLPNPPPPPSPQIGQQPSLRGILISTNASSSDFILVCLRPLFDNQFDNTHNSHHGPSHITSWKWS